MGYCKLCRQHMEDPYDCDCRCPHGEDVRLACSECEDDQ